MSEEKEYLPPSLEEARKLVLSNGKSETYETSRDEDIDILAHLKRRKETLKFATKLWHRRKAIEEAVAHHLGVSAAQCTTEHPKTWRRGAFNYVAWIKVKMSKDETITKVMRFPLPWKLGHPEVQDEKIRGEAASYAWIEKNCPEIPVAHLIGFGWSGYQFTHVQHLPWYRRVLASVWRFFQRCLGNEVYPYVRNRNNTKLDPYLLLDFIDDKRGVMLHTEWKTTSTYEPSKLQNLYRGLSRMILSLARVPHPHIGSLCFNDDMTVSLSQRPSLICHLQLESVGCPATIRGVYSHSSAFLADLFDFRIKLFEQQPNAAHNQDDCYLQMAHLVLLRSILPTMVDIKYSGPYVLQHTDLHQCNLYVDRDWNITGVIDLEFVRVLPPDMLEVPFWLSSADFIDAVDVTKFGETIDDFLAVLKEEEERLGPCVPVGTHIRQAWVSGAFWCYICLTSVNGLNAIMEDYIQPTYGFSLKVAEGKQFYSWLFKFWSKEADQVANTKLVENQKYDEELRTLFATSQPDK